jgi:hypothetical protein
MWALEPAMRGEHTLEGEHTLGYAGLASNKGVCAARVLVIQEGKHTLRYAGFVSEKVCAGCVLLHPQWRVNMLWLMQDWLPIKMCVLHVCLYFMEAWQAYRALCRI